ncbi:MAG TPA: NADH-quinone oxidoreductase subunit A [Anaeromyxobacteraceae bacterium]|nr:NADH-quinone oxidoreductase subunit A [Anaeromyxobacteraceae bacterium]
MGYEFGAIAAFAVMAVAFGFGGITIGRLAGPKLPTPEKSIIYECGELPIGSAWFNFNPRFYLIALVFVIFEVEIALTFPVVAVYREWIGRSLTLGLVALGELLLFTAILVLGLAWVWIHGDLEWVKKLARLDEPARPAGKRAA